MNVKNKHEPTLLFITTRGGAIAVSGNLNSTARKAMNVTAKVTSSPTTFGADQGYVVPPHWRARIKQTMLGTKKRRPRGSRRLALASRGRAAAAWLCGGGGGSCRKKKMTRRVKAPMGRLM